MKIKRILWFYLTVLIGTSIIISNSCKKAEVPSLTTNEITLLDQTSATSGGNILSEGGSTIISRGVCWGKNASPTISDSKTSEGAGAGSFTSKLTGLTAGTTYFVRAFATNANGTGYGMAMSFTTQPATTPVISTATITTITQNSAICGGTISSDGAASIISHGVCWSIIQNPTILDSKTSDGSGTGIFSSILTGLTGNTSYYVRAYATNSVGTEYGNQVSFKTSPLMATLSTAITSSITSSSTSSGGNISSDGGASIINRGVCWSTSANPTIADNKTTNGTGTGVFTSTVSGLLGSATYYLRAFATNSIGTAYGNEVSFITLSPTLPVLTTASVTNIAVTTATCGGNITNDGGAIVTVSGTCWSINPNPTIANNKTIDGTDTGSFVSNITGLQPGTTYYVKSYATNSIGTSYGTEISFKTNISDFEGNLYKVVTIGTQTWMAENLKATKYNDGTTIPMVTSGVWRYTATPAYCYYNNEEATYKATYGALYNWYAVNTGNLCPTGWHVPSEVEWTVLTDYLGGKNVAGGKLKETSTTHWKSPNTGSTNESGFTALPGGRRFDEYFVEYGDFYGISIDGAWWGSTKDNITNHVWTQSVSYNSSGVYNGYSFGERNGWSVRCIKD